MPISTDEWKELFDLIASGDKTLSQARKKLGRWHRTTIARAYNVASELYQRGSRTLISSEAQEIADKAKYEATPRFVEQAFSQYLQWSEAKEDKMSRHWNELSNVAKDISERLFKIRGFYPPTDEKVGELAVDYDEPELLELLDNPKAKWLLSHMKAEFPHLENFKTWADLKVKDITDELIDGLSVRATEGEFEGICQFCEKLIREQ